MKALISRETGGPETLEFGELPDREPGKGEILIDVKACSINFPDTLIIEDKYQVKPPRPFAPGSEVAGTVAKLGEGVEGFSVGDRIITGTGFGGLAEQAIGRAANCYHLPEKFSFAQGASLLMTYGTSIHALKDRGRIAEGDEVLVLGAAGGVGISGVELAKAYGARVVAGVSSEEKAQMARDAGADAVVIYDRAPFDKDASKALANKFKEACEKDGYDIVYDIVGGDYSEPAVRAIGWEGRFLVTGFPAGIAKLPLNLTLLKSCDVCGVFWGAFAARFPDKNRANIAELFDLWEAGKIAPPVSETYAFENAAEAIRKVGAREAVGKLVVEIG
ncbi:NADPH:quinone oxidoreductase family protein [Novosphingopyxis sp. YJ-S2-01]|uniref:NADPH:quinone oxidoreductase family protein n=1 Tax=Novosphingopyxis sp. YJ-S2-01 TaxID=2794021 RepID=UPI0018DE946A|nr:NADPH:quinone oxidoreductase family protein [Novosphingopyxis sp. YJ-S2-01]MBH9538640.1 NADPH:quinone oxidoreductase family protein [Novosphingopyxis sp. YJ-S2-01]